MARPIVPPFVFCSRLSLVASPENRGDDRSRRDAIDTHSKLCQLRDPDFGHMDHPGLACRIEGARAIRGHTGGAAVDAAATALLFHNRCHIFETQETGAEVGHQHLIEILHSEPFRRERVARCQHC